MSEETQDSKSRFFDVHEYLFRRGMIAIVWSINDVHSVSQGLSDEQALCVLTEAKRMLSSERGLTWTDIKHYVEDLYGKSHLKQEQL